MTSSKVVCIVTGLEEVVPRKEVGMVLQPGPTRNKIYDFGDAARSKLATTQESAEYITLCFQHFFLRVMKLCLRKVELF